MGAHRRTLVFGDDGSPSADVAWLWINSHTWPGWRLRVVAAEQPLPGPPPPHELTVLHPWEPSPARRTFVESGFATTEHLTAVADPRVALSSPADLVVIGPRGRGLLKALHLGSTAHWLLSRPPSPLVIARHGSATRRVVVCADGSEHSARAVDALCALPFAPVLQVTVLTIDDSWFDPELAASAAATAIESVGATVEVVLRHRPTTSAIMAYLDEAAPDLVVLGTRGNTGLRGLAIGSTARAVAQAAACSALVACADPLDEPGHG